MLIFQYFFLSLYQHSYSNMRKSILIISAMMLLLACGGKPTQSGSADAAVANSMEVMAEEEKPQSFNLSGTIGEDKASITIEKNGSDVMGVVTRCDYCEPVEVKGTWQGNDIKVAGYSLAGSHMQYELTVTGNNVQGTEILSAEGEVEKQEISMTILASASAGLQ